MTNLTTNNRYQSPRTGPGTYWSGGVHLLRIARAVWLTFRVRTFRFWTLGMSCYAIDPVRDFTLHLAVVSVGVKWRVNPPALVGQ